MKRILLACGLVLISGLCFWLARNFDLSQIARISPPTAVALLAITVVFMLNYAVGVTFVLRGMGQQVGVFRVYHVVTAAAMASYLGNLQLSVPVRLYLFKGILGVPLGIGASAVGVETLLWLAMMGLIVAVPVRQIWGDFVWLPSAAALAGCAAGALALRYFPTLGRSMPGHIAGLPLGAVKSFLSDMYAGMRSINFRHLGLAALCFGLNYAIDAVSLYLVLREFGYSINPFHLLYVIVLSYLAGTLSMIPMGLGTRDISFTILLTQLGPSAEVAALAAIIQRILRSLVPLVLSGISLSWLGIDHVRSLENLRR